MRKHYLDNGKAIASFLGIVFHSALVFTSTTWIIGVDYNELIPSLKIYTEYINLFRMPLFLFISGYFAAYSVNKYNFNNFVKNKFTRLGIPLIATLFTFNLLQNFVINVIYNESYSLYEFLSTLFPLNSEFTLSHLWFLYYVIIFSFMIYKYPTLADRLPLIIKSVKSTISKYIDIILIIINIGIVGSFLMIKRITEIDHALLSFTHIGIYLPYFLLGVLLYANWSYFNKIFIDISSKRFLILFIILVISLILKFYLGEYHLVNDIILSIIAKYTSLILVLALLFKYLNKSNKILRYMSDSSYSVYLIHQPIIVLVSFVYIKYVNINYPINGYILVFSVSTILIYIIDFVLIRNTKLGNFLFTGRLDSKNKVGKT